MIVLHRFAHEAEPMYVNPDLIVSIEARPDTVLTLTTGAKIVVTETPREVVERIRAWRVSVHTPDYLLAAS